MHDTLYDALLCAVDERFEPVRLLKRGARGSVTLLRHRDTGKRYIFRQFTGGDAVYHRLLTVDCPQLPRIEEDLGASAVYPGMAAFNVKR